MRPLCALLVPPLLAATACSDDPLNQVQPKIAVEPEALDFGVGVVGRDNPGMLAVINRGQGVLDLIDARIEPDDGIFGVVMVPDQLPPSGRQPAMLRFTPRQAKEVSTAQLILSSNDPERPELAVPLTGIGGIREIDVVPARVDFGVVNEGSPATRQVEIRNIGGDPLAISAVTFTSTAIDLGLMPGGFGGGALEPGTSTTVTLVYAPQDLGSDQGTLVILSNDEDEPRVEVPVTGTANLAPRAIAWGCAPAAGRIACDGAADRGRSFSLGVRQRLALDGRESGDPEGQPITFSWSLEERPSGSNAAVFHSTDDRNLRMRATGDLEVDVVGTYQLRLIVRDDRGLASFDSPESRITIRPKDLEVALRWDIATDVDLHLVRPGGALGDYGSGAAGTSTGSDTSSFNRRPNWGDLASAGDDPSLDIDDVSGRGPEIVSLDRPQIDGVYTAHAHYCDSRDVRVPVRVTLQVYLRGSLVTEIPSNGLGFALAPGEVWRAAQITWRENAGTPSVEVVDGVMESPVLDPSLCRVQ